MRSGLPHEGHVLLTGTSGAIGGALATALRGRRPRLRMTLVDRDVAGSARLAAALGGDVRVVGHDLADVEGVPGLVGEAEAGFGPVTGLVSCAGFMDVQPVADFPWSVAGSLLAVDLVAPLRMLHACVPGMVARGEGFIVNVTSLAGRVPLKGCAYYGAAKAGLGMASEIAHAELAPRGVTVVTVYPGPVASALERGARAQYGAQGLARLLPSGRPDVLATRVVDAVERRRARVVYPDLYAVGYWGGDLVSRFALAFGPEPRAADPSA